MNSQITQDEEHLRLLGIFHYVMAGLGLLFGCLMLLPMGLFGFVFAEVAGEMGEDAPPAVFQLIPLLFLCVLMVVVLTSATLIFFCGKHLHQHRHHTFCMVMAAIECMSVPLGTILGVFTIVVLMRPSVKELFAQSDSDYRIR